MKFKYLSLMAAGHRLFSVCGQSTFINLKIKPICHYSKSVAILDFRVISLLQTCSYLDLHTVSRDATAVLMASVCSSVIYAAG